jgi:ribonuclease J
MDWPEIRVFASHSQDERLKANPDYFGDFRKRLYLHRVKREELHATPESFLYFGKMSSFHLIDEFKNAAAPVNVIYSQWLGYLDGKHADYFGSDQIAAYRSDPAVNFVYAHTSGHAPVEDLKKLATALKPKYAGSHSHRTRRRFLPDLCKRSHTQRRRRHRCLQATLRAR